MNLFPNFYLNSRWKKISTIMDNIALRDRILSSSTDTRINSHNVWNDPEFVSKYSDRFFADGYALVEQTNHMVAKNKLTKGLNFRNNKSIPSTC